MNSDSKRPVYVIGHKNPDTDSICSAIAYSNFKTIMTGEKYLAMRAGAVNEETQYVLDYFGIDEPPVMGDVGSQVADIEIRKTEGVSNGISLKKAWELMKEQNVVTLPITTNDGDLEGLITIGDIANSYMDVYDNNILATARTKYKNIVEK